MLYPITLTLDDNNTFLVTCPLLPEVTSFGESEGEALLHAKDAVFSAFDDRVKLREIIPLPADHQGPQISVSGVVATKVALHNAMVEKGLRKADLVRLLRVHAPQVDRLLDFDHASKMEHLEAALEAIGLRVEIEIKPALMAA